MKKILAENIYECLKDKILYNSIRPGDMISEAYIEDNFHVSRTPARQALQKLEEKGLVEIQDGVGTFATFITQKQMEDAYQIRCAAEKIAIRTAIHFISESEIAELERKFLRFQSQLAKGRGYGAPFEEIVKTDWALHDLIINSSENKLLADSVEKVTLILRRYQMAYVSMYERATEDHLEIIRCIREKDIAGAEDVLDRHLQYRTF